MTLVISLFKAKESLLSIGIVRIVMYLRDVRIINLVKQFLYQNIEALCFLYQNIEALFSLSEHRSSVL